MDASYLPSNEPPECHLGSVFWSQSAQHLSNVHHTSDSSALAIFLPPPHPTFQGPHRSSEFWVLLYKCDVKNCDCDVGENNNARETDAKLQELVFSVALSSSISCSLRSASPSLPHKPCARGAHQMDLKCCRLSGLPRR